MTLDELLEKFDHPRRSGNGWNVRCPHHQDRQASLGITEQDGKLLLRCYAGCDTRDILDDLDLTFSDLWATRSSKKEEQKVAIEAIYEYTDEDGQPLFQSIRFLGKDFRQRHLEDGEWVWSTTGVRRVIYHLPEVLEAVRAGHTVYVVEGEKDADRLRSLGKSATCNPMGAGKWLPEFNEWFRGGNALIVADKDDPGWRHAENVRQNLLPVAANVWVYQAKGDNKDVSDHLDAGYTLEELVPVVSEVRRHYEPMNLFDPVPPVKWVVGNMVVGGEVTLLVADGGAGKSYFALAMSLAVASGDHFLDCPVKQGRVIYVDEEGSPDLALQRLHALGASGEQKKNLDYLNFRGVDLVNHPEKLLEDAKAVKPVLIVIDSHAKVTRMGEENSNNEMSRVWDEGFTPLARETMAAVLVIHHTAAAWSEKPRGATQIRNSADQVLTMKKQEDGSMTLYPSKPRRITDPLRFRFEKLPFEEQYRLVRL